MTAADLTRNVTGTSTKLRQLLRRRLRQLARVLLALAIGLGLASTSIAIWWLTSLNGLPDIGEPFDVAALRAFTIPDDQDAFAFFRRANERRGRFPLAPGDEAPAATGAWSEADPKVRAWAEANRPALELFLRGAGCADGISRRPGEPYSGRYSDELGPRYLILLRSWRAGGARRVAIWPGAGTAITRSSARRSTACGAGRSPSAISPPSTTAGCGNGSRPGRPIPGPRSLSSGGPCRRRSRAGRDPSGMRSRSRWNTWTGCATWRGRGIRCSMRSRRSRRIASAIWNCRKTWPCNSTTRGDSSCASPSAAVGRSGCSSPTGLPMPRSRSRGHARPP